MFHALEVTWWWKNHLVTLQRASNISALRIQSNANPSTQTHFDVRHQVATLLAAHGPEASIEAGQNSSLHINGLTVEVRWLNPDAADRLGKRFPADVWWMPISTGVAGVLAVLLLGFSVDTPEQVTQETLVQAGDCIHQRPGIAHYLFDYSPDMEYLEIVGPADFTSIDVDPVCPVPAPTPWK